MPKPQRHLTQMARLERDLNQTAELAGQLIEAIKWQQNKIEHQAEELTELKVQVRFLLDIVKVTAPGSAFSVGRPVAISAYTAYEKYQGRERTLDLLQAEYFEAQIALKAQELIANGDTREPAEIIDALKREDAESARAAGSEGNGRSDLAPEADTARSESATA